jgi:glycosyltransferase involved in cell wall biosynthesis
MSKPFRIGLVMQGGANWMGGAEYIKNIILALASLPSDVRSTFEIYLICDRKVDTNILDQIRPHLVDVLYLENPTIFRRIVRATKRIIFNEYYTHISKLLRKNSALSLDFVYPFFTTKAEHGKTKSAEWIPDFQHKYLPAFFTKKDVKAIDKRFDDIATYTNTIILSSQSAKNNFCEFFPDQKHKIKVLPFATIPSPEWYEINPTEVLEKYKIPEKFFLISNQFWQHKNHITVFYALKLLSDRGIYPTVVCTGSLADHRNKGYANEILETINKLGISKQVYLLGLIPKAHQIQLLRCSLAVIQPSLFEGWSTIVEEAKCFGKKIILSDILVHLEQNPHGGVFFQKDSPEQLSEILADLWGSLKHGLDIEQESISREANISSVKEFANNFISIVIDAQRFQSQNILKVFETNRP